MSTAIENPVSIVDGFLVTEDGEIIGHVQAQDTFHVTDTASAEWLLEKIMEADAALAAVELKQRAILDNLDAERQHQLRRKAFFEGRYGPELEAFARANLPKNAKTWRCPFGKVAFRTDTQGSVEIIDMQKAVAWARAIGLADKVKVIEKVLASDLKEKVLADPPTEPIFQIKKPGSESVKISTGVSP